MTTCATSSTVMSLRCGLSASSAARASASLRPVFFAMRAVDSATMPVSTNPGHTAFTVTPVAASSAASARVSPTSACFDAQYADVYAYPVSPAFDATFTTRPHPASTIAGTSARHSTNGAVTFTAIVDAHASSVVRESGALGATPALLISTSTRPTRAATSASAASIEARSARSHAIATPSAPPIDAATSSSSLRVRPVTTTRYPARPSALAMARPMPRPPPVTSAVRAEVVMPISHRRSPRRWLPRGGPVPLRSPRRMPRRPDEAPRGRPHWLDELFVTTTPAGAFFAEGWGDPAIVELVRAALAAPPPPRPIILRWGSPSFALAPLVRARIGTFASPVDDGTLPPESTHARVLSLMPASPRHAPPPPVCVHLAATGEQGFARRVSLALPLVAQGIGAVILENPLYGLRRPRAQRGAAVRSVADLMTMGRAAVEEARSLLLWLRDRGHARLGVSGYSMGGQLAAIAGALVDFPLALVPVAAPHAASAVFLDGVLRRAPCWPALAHATPTAPHPADSPRDLRHDDDHPARRRLRDLLDATCVTRQPPPHPLGAAIVLAARRDAYVAPSSAERVHLHWPGSELRWLDEGHVTGYLRAAPAVRLALRDAFARLAAKSP